MLKNAKATFICNYLKESYVTLILCQFTIEKHYIWQHNLVK